jgi:hypothetical protein
VLRDIRHVHDVSAEAKFHKPFRGNTLFCRISGVSASMMRPRPAAEWFLEENLDQRPAGLLRLNQSRRIGPKVDPEIMGIDSVTLSGGKA